MKEYEAFGEKELRDLTSEPYTIKVKYHEGASRIGGDIHGVMCDLAASETVELKQGEVKIIPLGVSMKLPYGDFGIVVPRSSTCLKHGDHDGQLGRHHRARLLRRRRRVGIRRLCDQGHRDRARNANRAVPCHRRLSPTGTRSYSRKSSRWDAQTAAATEARGSCDVDERKKHPRNNRRASSAG